MFKTFANAWKIPELRKKILFTALIVLIFRVGSAIPVPFTNILIEGGNLVQDGSTFLNYLIMMTGDAFNYGTLFALSITPYINSSIIMQLLCVAIPPLERLAKEEDGQKKIASITRYVPVVQSALFHMISSSMFDRSIAPNPYIITQESCIGVAVRNQRLFCA